MACVTKLSEGWRNIMKASGAPEPAWTTELHGTRWRRTSPRRQKRNRRTAKPPRAAMANAENRIKTVAM